MQNRKNKQKKKIRMAHLCPNITIINLNINDLNMLIKTDISTVN